MANDGLVVQAVAEKQIANRMASARLALEKATTIPEIKDLRDQTEVLRAYVVAQGGSVDLANDAAEFKIDCERKAGGVLAKLKAQGRLGSGKGKKNQKSGGRTFASLADYGIDKRNHSSNWQREAAVPQGVYRSWVKETRKAGKELTTDGLLKIEKTMRAEKNRDDIEAETKVAKKSESTIDDLKNPKLLHTIRCFYADPPWGYDDETVRGAAEKHYITLTLEDLITLYASIIKKLTHPKGAHFWMWTTWPKIRDGHAQRFIAACGFEWKSELVWNKETMGLGRWLRKQTEVCILATTKKIMPRLREDLVDYLGEARDSKHSKKPMGFYDIIESFSGGPFLELFARDIKDPREGWHYHGLEVTGKE